MVFMLLEHYCNVLTVPENDVMGAVTQLIMKYISGWNEYGWDDPAPQLPSLEVFPDSCAVEEFAQNVSSQHVIVAYGDYKEAIRDFCKMMDIELVM